MGDSRMRSGVMAAGKTETQGADLVRQPIKTLFYTAAENLQRQAVEYGTMSPTRT